ncbi:hypothetical protein [Arthrobacter sp. 49Tsu3.1M3]|nr:hypothetical protein [Arthrobacter sp. 49Tsu3.1M3]
MDGALPRPAAIDRRLTPQRCRAAMVIRSSSDKYRAEITAGCSGTIVMAA